MIWEKIDRVIAVPRCIYHHWCECSGQYGSCRSHRNYRNHGWLAGTSHCRNPNAIWGEKIQTVSQIYYDMETFFALLVLLVENHRYSPHKGPAIWILYWPEQTIEKPWPKLMQLSLEQQYSSVLHSQCHACWCSGDLRSQGISKHGIDPQSGNIPFQASEELTENDEIRQQYITLLQSLNISLLQFFNILGFFSCCSCFISSFYSLHFHILLTFRGSDCGSRVVGGTQQ